MTSVKGVIFISANTLFLLLFLFIVRFSHHKIFDRGSAVFHIHNEFIYKFRKKIISYNRGNCDKKSRRRSYQRFGNAAGNYRYAAGAYFGNVMKSPYDAQNYEIGRASCRERV